MNKIFGTRIAVLTGDFLFAQSSWFLANLDNLEVGCHESQRTASGFYLSDSCCKPDFCISCVLGSQLRWYPLSLALLHLPQVIKLISQVIADFANGEISQAGKLFDTSITLQVSDSAGSAPSLCLHSALLYRDVFLYRQHQDLP